MVVKQRNHQPIYNFFLVSLSHSADVREKEERLCCSFYFYS
jgi:hypothetical protein